MANKDGMYYQDWKKDYDKVGLTKKYYEASKVIGQCFSRPTLENLKQTYGAVTDYVSSIPLPQHKSEEREEFLEKLNDLSLILYGDPKNDKVKEKCKDMGVRKRTVNNGINKQVKIDNLPKLLQKLRDLLIQAGDFATSKGLRVTLKDKTKKGMKKLKEEEGFDNLNLVDEE